ncbi:MAG: hypothetical protein AAF675_06570 [Pseudomonadota bacterium]
MPEGGLEQAIDILVGLVRIEMVALGAGFLGVTLEPLINRRAHSRSRQESAEAFSLRPRWEPFVGIVLSLGVIAVVLTPRLLDAIATGQAQPALAILAIWAVAGGWGIHGLLRLRRYLASPSAAVDGEGIRLSHRGQEVGWFPWQRLAGVLIERGAGAGWPGPMPRPVSGWQGALLLLRRELRALGDWLARALTPPGSDTQVFTLDFGDAGRLRVPPGTIGLWHLERRLAQETEARNIPVLRRLPGSGALQRTRLA